MDEAHVGNLSPGGADTSRKRRPGHDVAAQDSNAVIEAEKIRLRQEHDAKIADIEAKLKKDYDDKLAELERMAEDETIDARYGPGVFVPGDDVAITPVCGRVSMSSWFKCICDCLLLSSLVGVSLLRDCFRTHCFPVYISLIL